MVAQSKELLDVNDMPENLDTADRQARKEAQQKQRMRQRLAQEEDEPEAQHLRTVGQKSKEEQETAYQIGTTKTSDGHPKDTSTSFIHFFDLPQEVRDMIYAYFPYLASIHINQDPAIVAQPSISQVCRRMRKESLDVFYGKNNFFLDLRGWKSTLYPSEWTPRMILEHWITAIGDENAARIRSLSFFSHNFRVNVRVSNERPPTLLLRFRTSLSKAEMSPEVPASYTFTIAAQRAETGLRGLLDQVQAGITKRGLTVENIKTISSAIDKIQPFLCRRISLGYRGASLLEDDVRISQWPDTFLHREQCDDCGYHRYTKEKKSAD